jgi:hypothetical protein
MRLTISDPGNEARCLNMAKKLDVAELGEERVFVMELAVDDLGEAVSPEGPIVPSTEGPFTKLSSIEVRKMPNSV